MTSYSERSPLSITLAPNLGDVVLSNRDSGEERRLPIIGYAVVVAFSYLDNQSDYPRQCADETEITPVVIDLYGRPKTMAQYLDSSEKHWQWKIERNPS